MDVLRAEILQQPCAQYPEGPCKECVVLLETGVYQREQWWLGMK